MRQGASRTRIMDVLNLFNTDANQFKTDMLLDRMSN